MLRQDQGKNAANLALCFAIFPSCSRPLGALPAGGEAVESQASAAPLGPANHYITFARDPGRRKRAAKDTFGPDRFIFDSCVAKVQINVQRWWWKDVWSEWVGVGGIRLCSLPSPSVTVPHPVPTDLTIHTGSAKQSAQQTGFGGGGGDLMGLKSTKARLKGTWKQGRP